MNPTQQDYYVNRVLAVLAPLPWSDAARVLGATQVAIMERVVEQVEQRYGPPSEQEKE